MVSGQQLYGKCPVKYRTVTGRTYKAYKMLNVRLCRTCTDCTVALYSKPAIDVPPTLSWTSCIPERPQCMVSFQGQVQRRKKVKTLLRMLKAMTTARDWQLTLISFPREAPDPRGAPDPRQALMYGFISSSFCSN